MVEFVLFEPLFICAKCGKFIIFSIYTLEFTYMKERGKPTEIYLLTRFCIDSANVVLILIMEEQRLRTLVAKTQRIILSFLSCWSATHPLFAYWYRLEQLPSSKNRKEGKFNRKILFGIFPDANLENTFHHKNHPIIDHYSQYWSLKSLMLPLKTLLFIKVSIDLWRAAGPSSASTV